MINTFPGAIQLVDLYHAPQHPWNLAPALYPEDAARQRRWIMAAQDKLNNGRIERVLTALRALRPAATEVPETLPGIADHAADSGRAKHQRSERPQKVLAQAFVVIGQNESRTCLGNSEVRVARKNKRPCRQNNRRQEAMFSGDS